MGGEGMMEYQTIEDAWRDFLAKVVRGRATPEQERDMRVVFFAGAGAVFGMMQQAADLPEPHSIVVLEGWSAEFAIFYATQAGR